MQVPIARSSTGGSSPSTRRAWRRRSAASSSSTRRGLRVAGTAFVFPALAMLLAAHKPQLGSCFLAAPTPSALLPTSPVAGESRRGAVRSPPSATSRLRMAASQGGDGGPEPLATEGDWSAYLDDQSTGLVYYFNARTGESRWVPPTPTFPEARLPRRMRQAAERKQAEYRKAVRQQEEVETKRKKGVLASLLLGDDDDDESARPVGASSTSVVTEEPPPSKQEEWFDFLSDRAPAASTVSSVAEPEVRTEKKESDWFGWGKGKEKKKDEPDWFGAFGKPTGEAASVGDFIVDEERVDAPEVVDEEKKKEEADWFSWLAPKGEPGQAIDVSPDASATDPPPQVREPAPKEPVLEPTPDEKWKKKKSVLGKIFGAVPSVSVEIPKPVGIERMKPELVEKPKPVAIEKPKPTVVEKPKPVVVEKPKPKREEKVAVEVEEAPTVVVPEMSTYVLPDPKKLFWGGEDATFVKGRTFGVFDGVSGADKVDGVPLYSLTLAREMKSRVGTGGMEMKDMIDALAGCVEVANKRATGASTALVGSISEDGVLRVLNVGDCTAIVVRGEKVVARTKEINHFYECPYQFSEISPDRPRDGTRLNLSLKKGDVIIAGSDGVFDNLEEEQIVREVTSSPRKAGIIAKRVSDLSRRISQNPKAITPFSKLALKKKNPDYPDGIGGKVDDVCCVAICYG